jgi:16S rRNA (cytosine967-C5)-methyltransferase
MAEGVTAREAAVAILDGVLGEGRMLSDFEGSGLAPADRARALRLAQTVLRHLEPADKVLDRHLRKAPPLTARNVLRLAVVELAQGAPAHGVVNAAVEILRKGKRTADVYRSALLHAVQSGWVGRGVVPG